jgi:hypothetical protein
MTHGLAATGLPQRGDHSLHAAVGLIGGSPTIIRTSAWTAAFRRQGAWCTPGGQKARCIAGESWRLMFLRQQPLVTRTTLGDEETCEIGGAAIFPSCYCVR